ncbi:Hypothetical predicted protein [Paramuricea clavata]|uniref:Uncharacterized protein n=1 Tax=Paramuricea clavata TaxID=317549 RepID=A0A6S7H279_PARCT|nr:Hypothetical predicted protein [Paramuricea clavata]
MFTRIPTFIPTESLETVNEQSSRKEVKKATYSVGQGRRKRAKAIRKRISTKKDNHCEELPVISGRESRARAHTLQTPTHFHKLRNSKLFESRTTSPYTTPVQKTRINSELNRRVRRITEHSDPMTVGDILSMGMDLTHDETEPLTHPTVHTRNRRKLTDDTQDTQVKKQAKKWLHTQVDNNMDTNNTSRTIERVTSRSESITDTESSLRTPLQLDIQSSLRSSSAHFHDNEVSKIFKSKIPVRFPDIQENRRYTAESKVKYSPSKLTTHLPQIVGVNSSKNLPDNSERVTQSILDYQSIVEQDFKRLGENLESTFKLLQQYIRCNTNVNAST